MSRRCSRRSLQRCRDCTHQSLNEISATNPRMNYDAETSVLKDAETGRLLDLSTAPKGVLIKGLVYFAAPKLWKHAILGTLLPVLTLGVSWRVYAVYVKKLMRACLLAAGRVPVS